MDDSSDEDDVGATENSVMGAAAMDQHDRNETSALDVGQRDFEGSLCRAVQQSGKLSCEIDR